MALRSELAEEAAARARDRVAAQVRSEELETALRREVATQRELAASERATALGRDEELRTALSRQQELQSSLAVRHEELQRAELSVRRDVELESLLEAAEQRVQQLNVLNRGRAAVSEHSAEQYAAELRELQIFKIKT